jgi:DNA-binding response OmpR family regulator
VSGLEAIRQHNPDLVIVDWEMPMIDGAQFVRMVRSPGEFPMPDVPIIMLSGHGDRWRVVEAARIGAHEYLLKPVSTKALLDRIVAVVARPRPFVQMNGYYGPAPRGLVVVEDKEIAGVGPGPLRVGEQAPAQDALAAQAVPQPSATPQAPATPQPSAMPQASPAPQPAAEGQNPPGRKPSDLVFVN